MKKSHILIALKSGSFIEMDNFKEVNYRVTSSAATVTIENFDTFSLVPGRSYTFIGDKIFSLMGSEILYITLG